MSLDRRPIPPLHVVTDDEVLRRPGWADAAVAVLEAGGPRVALHVRGPTSPARRLYDLSAALAPEARRRGAWLAVNDRVDVALAVDADAVHLRGNSLDVGRCRSLSTHDVAIGVSCHSREDVISAGSEGADYAFVGTIYATASHPGIEGIGTGGLAKMIGVEPTLPVLGIGGVSTARVGDVMDAGSHGVAVLRGVWDAEDPADAVERYLAELARVQVIEESQS